MKLYQKMLIFFLGLFVVLFQLIVPRFFQAYWVPTKAMEPTLLGEHRDVKTQAVSRPGDRLFARKITSHLENVSRGDIIVFKFPDKNPQNPPRDFVKRLIGLPGDRVKIQSGRLFINEEKIDEPYVSEPALTDFEAVVPPDSLFVLGDNRNNSMDSRYWGCVPLANLKGIAFFIYFPFDRFGYLKEHKIQVKAR